MKILPDWMVDISECFDDCIVVLHMPCEDHFSLYYLCFSILFHIFVPIIYIWLTFCLPEQRETLKVALLRERALCR